MATGSATLYGWGMRRRLPPWALGLALAPMGFYFGFNSTGLPILLAGQGVPLDKIAYVSAVGFSPTFWAFLLCPILDVRFTRRTYAFVMAAVAACCLGASTLVIRHLTLLTVFLAVGCTATVMFQNAVCGWLPDVIEDKDYDETSAWSNIANLGAAGFFGMLAIVLVRHMPLGLAAAVLGFVLIAPTALLFSFLKQCLRREALPRRFERCFGISIGCAETDAACWA